MELETYGKKNVILVALKNLFRKRSGWIQVQPKISLSKFDLHEEEM